MRTKAILRPATRTIAHQQLIATYNNFSWERYTGQQLPGPASSVSSTSNDAPPAAKKPRRMAIWKEAEDQQEESEVAQYLADKRGIQPEEDPMKWWKANCTRYPKLAAMARLYLAIPASSASAERSFSVGPLVLQQLRRQLDPERVGHLMWMKKNMKVYTEIRGKPSNSQ